MRESPIEKRLRVKVEEIGGKAIKLISPGNNGVPDRLVILPNGRTVYVETKAPGEPLRPLQAWWADKLRKLGHTFYKIDSYADVDQFIWDVMLE